MPYGRLVHRPDPDAVLALAAGWGSRQPRPTATAETSSSGRIGTQLSWHHPKLSLTGLIDIGRCVLAIRAGAAIQWPAWDARRAWELDDVSLGEWLRLVRAIVPRGLITIMTR